MSDGPAKRPWVPHRPEQRFSVVVERFLNDALAPPFYATAIQDSDGGGRTDQQRARDRARGQKPGQLDWDICQGPDGLWRKLELKRGRNDLSDNQRVTIAKLALCGARPVVAWELWQVHRGLLEAGFLFRGNVETLLQKYVAQLDAMDRTAELTVAGQVKPKRAFRAKARTTATVAQGHRMGAWKP